MNEQNIIIYYYIHIIIKFQRSINGNILLSHYKEMENETNFLCLLY